MEYFSVKLTLLAGADIESSWAHIYFLLQNIGMDGGIGLVGIAYYMPIQVQTVDDPETGKLARQLSVKPAESIFSRHSRIVFSCNANGKTRRWYYVAGFGVTRVETSDTETFFPGDKVAIKTERFGWAIANCELSSEKEGGPIFNMIAAGYYSESDPDFNPWIDPGDYQEIVLLERKTP